MLLKKEDLRMKNLVVALFLVIGFSSLGYSASVQKCSVKTRRCIVRIEHGIVGDTVSVLNEKAQLVATGWIIKRKGVFGVVSFKRVFYDVKRGYPVIVNLEKRGKEVTWASAYEDPALKD